MPSRPNDSQSERTATTAILWKKINGLLMHAMPCQTIDSSNVCDVMLKQFINYMNGYVIVLIL